MPEKHPFSHNDLNQEEVSHSIGSSTMNKRSVQWVLCNRPVCAVGDHVLLESKKDLVKKHSSQRSKNSL